MEKQRFLVREVEFQGQSEEVEKNQLKKKKKLLDGVFRGLNPSRVLALKTGPPHTARYRRQTLTCGP